jgi:cellulose biosynthesis protein BcsQ
MTRIINLFNHKGGVSKTTTTFNLGWMLAELGHRVVIVDADSQCNLTGMVLGYRSPEDLEAFYLEHPDQNLYSALAPAFESQPRLIEGVECLAVEGRDRLFLLPGHVGLSEYEVTLGIAQELSGSIQTLQNLPGSVRYLLETTAERMQADFVLIDMSPGLGAMNQNLLTTGDFHLIPASPDFFSVMAMDSLARIVPQWQQWAEQASRVPILRSAVYPFPMPHSKFIGTIVQKYRPRGGSAAQAFQDWIARITDRVHDNLVPALGRAGMLLPQDRYQEAGLDGGYCLAEVPDFNSLIAKSQDYQTPVFALTATQLGVGGAVLENQQESRDRFHTTFSMMASRILQLTADVGD